MIKQFKNIVIGCGITYKTFHVIPTIVIDWGIEPAIALYWLRFNIFIAKLING